eukprot:4727441-Amphidinium_carterae.1
MRVGTPPNNGPDMQVTAGVTILHSSITMTVGIRQSSLRTGQFLVNVVYVDISDNDYVLTSFVP